MPVLLSAGNAAGKGIYGRGHLFGVKPDIARDSNKNVLVVVFKTHSFIQQLSVVFFCQDLC